MPGFGILFSVRYFGYGNVARLLLRLRAPLFFACPCRLSLLFFPLSLAGSGKVGEILSSRIHFFYQKRNEFCPVFHLFFDFFFEKKRIPEKFSLKSKIFDLRAHSITKKGREKNRKWGNVSINLEKLMIEFVSRSV